ncbi:MAG: helix-turn-helix domain-containing protein [Candidatus Schmidhempelia sp.]|nr:helix-turn-helix domain-containing protein [Candidatus Schmidhempelia sp.]
MQPQPTNIIVLEFKNRLQEIMQELTVSAFAKKCGMSETVIRDYLSGKTFPSLNRLASIAEKCNVSFCWLATGYDLQDIPAKHVEIKQDTDLLQVPLYKKFSISTETHKKQRKNEDIPLTMQGSILNTWIEQRDLDLNNLISYRAKGKLMHPDIQNNDGLIINTDYDEIVDGDIYLIEYEESTLIRKIHKTTEGWLLLSNDDKHTTIKVDNTNIQKFNIVGKVILITRNIY